MPTVPIAVQLYLFALAVYGVLELAGLICYFIWPDKIKPSRAGMVASSTMVIFFGMWGLALLVWIHF